MSLKDCTLVILTYNRPNFLNRLLQFLHSYGIDIPILVADASNQKIHRRNIELLQKYPNTDCIYIPDRQPIDSTVLAASVCSSSYIAFCHDDDFTFPDFLTEAIDFLKRNPDYVLCTGRYGIYDGEMTIQSNTSCELDDPLERLSFYLSNMSLTLFSVWRKEAVLKLSAYSALYPYFHYMQEIVYTSFCVLLGKIKVLDKLSVVRVHHSTNLGKKVPGSYCIGNEIVNGFDADTALAVKAIKEILPNKSEQEIRTAFISGLLKHFSSFAFLHLPHFRSKLSDYNVVDIDSYSPLIQEFVSEICPVSKTTPFSMGEYFEKVFKAKSEVQINYQPYLLERERQMELNKPRLEYWKQAFLSDLHKRLHNFKFIEVEEKGFTDTELIDLLFLREFFCSIEGCYIPEFEPACIICKKIGLESSEVRETLECLKSLVDRYPIGV